MRPGEGPHIDFSVLIGPTPGVQGDHVRSIDPSRRLLGVVVQDSGDLLLARFKSAVAGIDHGTQFCERHELDTATAKLVPDTAVGRMLGPDEAAELLRRIERGMPKRPPAASVKRRAAGRKRA